MKNSFIINYATNLWLVSVGATGPLGAFLAFFITRILGDMADRGLIKLDIAIDRVKEALKDPQWREAALKAYNKASDKVYTEEEKDEIRKEYMAALSAYATYGNGVPDNKHTKR